MDKYSRYYGIGIFCLMIALSLILFVQMIMPVVQNINKASDDLESVNKTLVNKQQEQQIVKSKLQQLRNSISNMSKKIYSPSERDLGNDTLFFTLYSDLIEMIKSNSIKVKSMEYYYNPSDDAFVKYGKDIYFVCAIDMELISNYVNLGKFIQDIYQYPYYMSILKLNVKPYPKDKKILITNITLRLYTRTSPNELVQ